MNASSRLVVASLALSLHSALALADTPPSVTPEPTQQASNSAATSPASPVANTPAPTVAANQGAETPASPPSATSAPATTAPAPQIPAAPLAPTPEATAAAANQPAVDPALANKPASLPTEPVITPVATPDKSASSTQAAVEAEPTPLTPIWKPKPGLHWQWQMTGKLDKKARYDLWVIDLFAYDTEDIKALHQAGRKVACSFSGGVYEPARDLGANVPASRLGEPNEERPGGRWLDIRQPGSKQWLQAQLKLAQSKGCDAVLPDHLYAYAQNSGFTITPAEQIDFNRWVADSAHQLRLAIGLHNDVEQIRQLEKKFDFALNEQCFTFNECEAYQPFLQAGKAVLGVEFEGEPTDFCPQANAKGMDWLKKTLKLDAERIACRK